MLLRVQAGSAAPHSPALLHSFSHCRASAADQVVASCCAPWLSHSASTLASEIASAADKERRSGSSEVLRASATPARYHVCQLRRAGGDIYARLWNRNATLFRIPRLPRRPEDKQGRYWNDRVYQDVRAACPPHVVAEQILALRNGNGLHKSQVGNANGAFVMLPSTESDGK